MTTKEIAKEIRRKILKMNFDAKGSHIGSSLSCVEILTALYFKVLKINPQKPRSDGRDRFVLSKGHAAAALYAVLAQRGFFPENVLAGYCKDGGKLAGHSIRGCVPGVEVSTGSLGHGLPMANGMALAGKRDKKKHRIFVLMSDGEMDCGTTWESALIGAHHKLDNLIVIVDFNGLQAMGEVKDILNIEPLKDKWQAFDWEVREIDGHNFERIEKSLTLPPLEKGKPRVIIAKTIKGYPISFMRGNNLYHYKNLSEKEYLNALKELQ